MNRSAVTSDPRRPAASVGPLAAREPARATWPAAVALLGTTGHYTLDQVSLGATTPTTLDSGAIDPASLKLSAAGVLTWTNAGVQHSQTIA